MAEKNTYESKRMDKYGKRIGWLTIDCAVASLKIETADGKEVSATKDELAPFAATTRMPIIDDVGTVDEFCQAVKEWSTEYKAFMDAETITARTGDVVPNVAREYLANLKDPVAALKALLMKGGSLTVQGPLNNALRGKAQEAIVNARKLILPAGGRKVTKGKRADHSF